MTCETVQRLLHPYIDGALDLVRTMEMEDHFSTCSACRDQEERLRALRGVAANNALYHRAPAALRAKVDSALHKATRKPSTSWRWFARAAAVLLLIGIGAAGARFLVRDGAETDERLAEWVVASHIRSLQATHLTDVMSTDRHTVKPWFVGKLDFSPNVPDLSGQGFELVGGRMDYLGTRPVASLIYRRRQHVINLFTWPAAPNGQSAVQKWDRQGFHARGWQESGMNYWAASDLNDKELDEFVKLFQGGA